MPRIGIKAECETIKHDDGRQDVIVRVPLIKLKGKLSDGQWKEVKRKLCDRKFADLKEACLANGDEGQKEWEEFVDLQINEKFVIRAKTLDDARNRAYRIAEKYGFNIEGLADIEG